MYRLLLLILFALCVVSQRPTPKGPPRLPWWAQHKAPNATGSSRRPPTRTRPAVTSNEVMTGVMDEMPAGSPMLLKAPSNFSMLPTSNRIINGQFTYITSFPYQLQLAVYGRQGCGASIISRLWAITAAHCMFDNAGQRIPLNAITLRAGSTNRNKEGVVHMINMRIMPGQYDPKGHDYDIALLRVETPFVFTRNVKPIALPKYGQKLRDGDVGVLTGWGHTANRGESSEMLQYVLVPLVNQDKCAEAYNTATRKITPRMICAGAPNRDSCQGDSGGPLAINGHLVGIVSFGVGCALEGFPGVNTRVSAFRDFISKHAGV